MNGVEVKIERIRLGLRQYEVAKRAGIRDNELSAFECGHKPLTGAKLQRVLQVLGEARDAVPA